MNLKIRIHPDEILRKPAEEIKFPLSPNMPRLMRDMFDTVQAAKGVGLAAPQIGKSIRLIVINLEHLDIPIFGLINPKIKNFGGKKLEMEEGCLSIPGVYGMVKRPDQIEFIYQDLEGKKHSAEASGLMSRVIQHEIDHINGILILDKITKYTQGEELVKDSVSKNAKGK